MMLNEKQHGQVDKILPVMFDFFVMGFFDLIGIASNYVKQDFELNASVVNLVLFSCFLWFLVISMPTGMIMNKKGYKKTMLLSYLFAFLGLFIPCFSYNFEFMIAAFAFIGVGSANLFSIVSSLALKAVPHKANEIPSLLIVGDVGWGNYNTNIRFCF